MLLNLSCSFSGSRCASVAKGRNKIYLSKRFSTDKKKVAAGVPGDDDDDKDENVNNCINFAKTQYAA